MRKLIFALLFSSAAIAEPYIIHTVDYPPFIDTKLSQYSPTSNALLNATTRAFECAGIDYEINMHTTWDSAADNVVLYRHAVFAADVLSKFKTRTAKSVDTGFTVTHSVYSHVDARNIYTDLDDLKGKRIGVIADRITGNYDFDRMYLTDKGAEFSKYIDTNHALVALAMGWIDYAVLPEEAAELSLRYDFGRTGNKLQKVGAVNKAALRLIFNRNTPQEIIEKVQDGFELTKLPNSQKFCQ